MKKRILFLINSLRAGGAERLLIDLLKYFDYNRYDVSLFYFIKDGIYVDEIPSQVHAECIIGMGSRYNNIFRKCLKKIGCLERYYCENIRRKAGEYDVIVSYLEGFPACMHSCIMDKGVRNLSFIHTDMEAYNSSSADFFENLSQDLVYQKMDELVFVSKHSLLSFERVYPQVTTTKTVLRNFIDIQEIENLSRKILIQKKKFTVVTVGRLAPIKGMDLIPYIARRIKDLGLGINFVIVGEGSERDKISDLILKLDVSDLVSLVGFHRNPYPYILNADLYINTSHAEGMPLSLCEAMILGKPVIATDTAGAKELLSNNVGVLLERDYNKFADAIVMLFKKEDKLKEYAERGHKFAQQFDAEHYLSLFYKIIDS